MSDDNAITSDSGAGDEIAEARKILGARQWPYTYKLGVPVEFGKETIESLVFQKGTFGVLKGIDAQVVGMPSIDQLMLIASRLCCRPLKVIEMLDPDDADEVIAVALGFFGRCRGAGKKL